jgi:hypothetical protein
MRYTRPAVLAAFGLMSMSACSSPGGTEPSAAANEVRPAAPTAKVPATEEERQREIERRAALRGQSSTVPATVPQPAPGTEPAAIIGEVPDTVLASMKADLATRLGRSVDAARVLRAEQVIWPDGSIGCARPGVLYTQATVVGYLVELELEAKVYRYHSALNGAPIYCEHPGPHVRTLGPTK